MSNNAWKEAERQYAQSKGETFNNNKYSNWDRTRELFNGAKRIAKWIIIGIVVIMFLMSLMSPALTWYKLSRKDTFKQSYNLKDIEEIAVKTNAFDNGFYIYKTNTIKDIEIHAVSIATKNVFIEDATDRFTKYYFEKWENSSKKEIKVEETYEDYKVGMTTKENWFLHYKLYIEAKNYEEVKEGVELILSFRNYVNNNNIILPCYIRINGKVITLIKASYEIDSDIRKNAKLEYDKIVNNY